MPPLGHGGVGDEDDDEGLRSINLGRAMYSIKVLLIITMVLKLKPSKTTRPT